MTTGATPSIDPYRRAPDYTPKAPSEDFSFGDALDIVNPLQHLPLVGWLYREITGDTIKPAAAIVGGALYGGPIGFAGAMLSAAFENMSGEAPEEAVARLILPSDQARGLAAYEQASGLAGG
jgi:hypothetical protein